MWIGRTPLSRLLLPNLTLEDPRRARYVSAALSLLYPDGVPVQSSDGIKLNINHRDHIPLKLLREEMYEPLTIALAQKITAEGGVFIDAGANVGLHAICVAANPKVRCIAIEPFPENLSSLRNNVILNHLPIEVLPFALDSSPGIVELSPDLLSNLGMVRIKEHHDYPSVKVEAKTLKDVFSTYGISGPIKLLKLDVEGHELRALMGIDWSFGPKPSNIIVEFFDDDHRGPLCEYLEERGYVGRTVLGVPLCEIPDDNRPLYKRYPECNAWFTAEA
jgi:FkbM family methyltransferase